MPRSAPADGVYVVTDSRGRVLTGTPHGTGYLRTTSPDGVITLTPAEVRPIAPRDTNPRP